MFARMLPDLHDSSVPHEEDDRLAVLGRSVSVALAARGLEHDMVVAREDVVDLAAQGAAGELGQSAYPRAQLLLPVF
jgi:hypothetical protein